MKITKLLVITVALLSLSGCVDGGITQCGFATLKDLEDAKKESTALSDKIDFISERQINTHNNVIDRLSALEQKAGLGAIPTVNVSPASWWESYSNVQISSVSYEFPPATGHKKILIGEFVLQSTNLLNIKGLPVAVERLGEVVEEPFSELVMEINWQVPHSSDSISSFAGVN